MVRTQRRGRLRGLKSTVVAVGAGLLAPLTPVSPVLAGEPRAVSTEAPVERGKMLFHHVWSPNDPLSNGDGLGPVFNERSCVACHNLGGSGGAGANSKNVQLLGAVLLPGTPESRERDELAEFHQGFRSADSVVLHRFGLDPSYKDWRLSVVRKLTAPAKSLDLAGFTVSHSQRNTPPLFGLGLIASIPDWAIEEGQNIHYPECCQARGRVCRDNDGSIGRFGWKAQLPTLRAFVMAACAGELGLETPSNAQALSGRGSGPRAHPVDLTMTECDALFQYVASLPRPALALPTTPAGARSVREGQRIFVSIGCAACHVPMLAEVDGLYSDLLVHDMGARLQDSSFSYGGSVARPRDLTSPTEWRTPPLWGLRDSAPYLHDGRARTIEDAIFQHDGEASNVTRRFDSLRAEAKQHLLDFLGSLAAPRSKPPSRGRNVERTTCVGCVKRTWV
ncbi:MAG TPA: di-heme oxidoredictase family protein [Isosphaeraceae bacterium]|nr:di-heme oxidoredictase family protein [Isosphaeraceae bacterium]